MNESDAIAMLMEHVKSRFYGKYRGVVVAHEESPRMARLQVQVPSVLGDAVVWALPCVPYAGPGVGLHSLPPIGAGVWVEFEAGLVSYPIWVGCFWGEDQLPEAVADAATDHVWRTDATEQVNRATSGSEGITLRKVDGGQVVVDASVTSTAGNSTHTVSESAVSSEVGGTSVEQDASRVSMNNGALEVY